MEIILIRHTQIDNPEKLCYGHYAIPLSSDFVLQANEVKFALSRFSDPIKPQIIYSSPAERCMKLAEILALNDLGYSLPIVSDDRLKELNFGTWEGMPWIQIPSIELFAWMDNYVHIPAGSNGLGSDCFNTEGNLKGESYLSLYNRTKLFIEEYLWGTQENKLVISHAGPIRIILAYFLNLNLYEAINLKVPYGSMFRISLNPGLKAIVYPLQ